MFVCVHSVLETFRERLHMRNSSSSSSSSFVPPPPGTWRKSWHSGISFSLDHSLADRTRVKRACMRSFSPSFAICVTVWNNFDLVSFSLAVCAAISLIVIGSLVPRVSERHESDLPLIMFTWSDLPSAVNDPPSACCVLARCFSAVASFVFKYFCSWSNSASRAFDGRSGCVFVEMCYVYACVCPFVLCCSCIHTCIHTFRISYYIATTLLCHYWGSLLKEAELPQANSDICTRIYVYLQLCIYIYIYICI